MADFTKDHVRAYFAKEEPVRVDFTKELTRMRCIVSCRITATDGDNKELFSLLRAIDAAYFTALEKINRKENPESRWVL